MSTPLVTPAAPNAVRRRRLALAAVLLMVVVVGTLAVLQILQAPTAAHHRRPPMTDASAAILFGGLLVFASARAIALARTMRRLAARLAVSELADATVKYRGQQDPGARPVPTFQWTSPDGAERLTRASLPGTTWMRRRHLRRGDPIRIRFDPADLGWVVPAASRPGRVYGPALLAYVAMALLAIALLLGRFG